MNINNLQEAELILRKYVPNVGIYTGDGMSLERMWPLLEAVGNPHDKLRVIHVAGTSGKTSTCYYIAALLNASAKKVGLTVSPHVDSILERIQIGGELIEESIFCRELKAFLELIKGISIEPTYFELLVAFELWMFAKFNVDYVVLETGMGGLLDATNVVTRSDKICVITDIGYDHTQILGNTIAKIAAQKAGIIQAKNYVLMHEQTEEIRDVISKKVVKENATLSIESNLIAKDSQLPIFQSRNYTLARAAAEYVATRDGFELTNTFSPSMIKIPGRMQRVKLDDNSIVVLDGAHNQQKVATLVDSFIKMYGSEKVPILLALKKGKEYKEVVEALLPIAAAFILTTFRTSQDLPAIAENPSLIAEYIHSCSDIEVKIEKDSTKAYKLLTQNDSQTRLVVGSFYLLGQLRAFVKP